MKQFYSGMADFLQMMVDQSLKQCDRYQYPIEPPNTLSNDRDREIYLTAHNNGYMKAMGQVNDWLDIAIKPEEQDQNLL